MKQYLVIVVLLTVVANSQCGLIDGFLGTVKDTTHSIKSNVGGVLHYSKSMVFGSSETNAEGYTVTKPGIVGKISLKIHDVSQGIRNVIRHILSITDNDGHGGLVSRVLYKFKKFVFDIKEFLLGSRTRIIYKPIRLSDDTNSLCEKLRKYISRKRASGKNHTGLTQTILSLHDAIDKIRNNKTKTGYEPKAADQNEDGTGLIDIRTSANDLNNLGESPYGIHKSSNAFYPDVDNGVDNVVDTISKQSKQAEGSLDSIKQSTNDFIKDQKTEYNNNLNQLNDGANKLKSNLDTTLQNAGSYMKAEKDKAIDEMKNSYNNINNKVTDGANKIKNNLNDAAIHFRDETEDAAGAVNNAYKKVDFDATKVLGDTN